MPRYNPAAIEPKWQAYWETHKSFKTPRLPTGPKLYVLDMFPYPSGSGLHVGHTEGYSATDMTCRFERMRGKCVLHPMGWDAFGLPAEQHAKQTGTPPRVTTEKNTANFRRQLKLVGFSYDWDRELATTDVDYFRWTQWIFLLLFDTWFDSARQQGRPIAELPIPAEVQQAGPNAVRTYQDSFRLAYQQEAPVNWCPKLGTVLANEEVKDGKSERGNHPVVRIPLRQWMLRITAYADRLEEDLAGLDWSEGIKALQRNWIGRSTGGEVDFFIGRGGQTPGPADFERWQAARKTSGYPQAAGPDVLRIYTTRPDTLFGATYMVIAPEHPLVERLTTLEQKRSVASYCEQAARKSDQDRTNLSKTKTGVPTGSYAINPANGQNVPIWIADYVLATYGTGAIMAVPGHDTRDFEFATVMGLPIVPVVAQPGEKEPATPANVDSVFVGEGTAANSGSYNGLSTCDFKARIVADLAAAGIARQAVNYKLRDWLFSRQHFWGEPFPILRELDEHGQPTGQIRALSPQDLPLDLPEMPSFKQHDSPEPPLEQAPEEWLYPVIDGRKYKRETNTMPQWAGSCWYYLRFLDPANRQDFVDPEVERAWMPVDLYIGGAEHAVLHLLYARFWHKVLYDRGHISTSEPFHRLVNQGMILGADGQKMAKSRGNVVNPDDVVQEHGADSLRLYEMFLGPLEATKPWNQNGVKGVRDFLGRAWRLIVDDRAEDLVMSPAVQNCPATPEQQRVLHRTIMGVTQDLERLQYNTAIAKLMEFTNFFTSQTVRPREVMETFVKLLSPLAPHLAAELWELLGHPHETLVRDCWPSYAPAWVQEDTLEIPVQISGKLRAKVVVPAAATNEEVEQAARNEPKISSLLAGAQVTKVIVIPKKLVNIVVKG